MPECWFAQAALTEKLLVWWQNKLESNYNYTEKA